VDGFEFLGLRAYLSEILAELESAAFRDDGIVGE
jgi:hypothetical protein